MMRVLTVVVVFALGGCSLFLQPKPPDPPPPAPAPIECSQSGGYAGADFVIGVVAGLAIGGLAYIASNIGAESTGPKPGQAIVLGGVVAAPWILSGIAGRRWARKCQRLVEERKLAPGGSTR
jgi:hypothetical protein